MSFIAAALMLFFVSETGREFLLPFSGLLVIYIVIISVASFHFRLNFFLDAIHKGEAGKIAITFDDGPHPVHTPAVLEILKNYNAHATFFLIGKHAEAQPDVVRDILKYGHDVGNHSYSHSNFNGFFSASREQVEIEKTNKIIQNISGSIPRYFRPPFGVTNPSIAKAVKATGMIAIGWDLRSFDTVISDERKLLRKILAKISSSTVVLLHDTQPVTVKVLPQILEFCREKGIEIVPLRESIINR